MNTRSFLFLIVGLLAFMLYLEWQKDYSPPQPEPTSAPLAESEGRPEQPPIEDLPEVPDFSDEQTERLGDIPQAAPVPEARASRRIAVSTDVLSVDVDASGGSLVDLRLKDYPISVDQPNEAFTLLLEDLPERFIAQSGLVSGNHPAPNHRSQWQFERDYYELSPGQDRLEVPLRWQHESGLEVVATWIFHRGDYVIDLTMEVINNSGEEWLGARYVQLQRTRPDFSDAGLAFTNPERFSYNGTAVYSPEDALNKISWDRIADRPLEATISGGWAAMIQHYFLVAWIPPEEQMHRYTTRYVTGNQLPHFVLAATSPQVVVPAGETHQFSARLFAGPKLQNRLDEIAPGLRLTVDYRIFTIIARPLFWALDKIHLVINHWGWSIVGLVMLVKLLLFPLATAQYKSMARMRKFQPRMQQLKERYGDDKQKFQVAMMELYKKEKINPVGGCLPVLLQMPIFFALYWVLLESVELRHAPWIGWIQDLTARDPWFILPAINMAVMWATQKLSPMTGMDPMQQRMMQLMPLVFGVMMVFFPAGLVLYWVTNGGLGLLQQWYMLRKYADAPPAKA